MQGLSKPWSIDARRTTNPIKRRVRSRGVPPALENHEIFYTEDPEEASTQIGRTLAPNRLALGEVAGGGFAASMHGVRLRDVSLLYLNLQVAVSMRIPHCGAYFAVHMPTNGRSVGVRGDQRFEANTVAALVTDPGDPLEMRFDHDSPQLIVRIEQNALERYLARLLGRMLIEPLTFQPLLDLSTDAAMRWHGALQILHTELFYEGSLVHNGRGVGPLEEFLMSSLLMLHGSNYHAQLIRPEALPGRRTVRHALDYIEHHLSDDISMVDIAHHAGVSIRSIQQGFRDELGVAPMGYLRDRRLERARDELTDSQDSNGVTVTGIAEHWGFNHPGSFSILYRKRWGESPSQTLRR